MTAAARLVTNLRHLRTIARLRSYRAWFNWRCRGIEGTPPVQCDPASRLVIVSQLYSPDVVMYLLAAKSFCRFVRPQRFVIVDDGLTPQERTRLEHHLGTVEYVRSSEVGSDSCPRGGCWERLLTLSLQNATNYVVQLDSDTLTLAPPREVLDCIERNVTFTLGTPTGRRIVSAEEAAAHAHADPHPHIQNRVERAFDRLADARSTRYVRGCAGFTGFAAGQLARDRIEALARELAALVGAQAFAEWGTEQVVSNLMAANAPDALVLPVDSYPFWAPGLSTDGLVFIHFFGTFRYLEGMYLRQALALLDSLKGASVGDARLAAQ